MQINVIEHLSKSPMIYTIVCMQWFPEHSCSSVFPLRYTARPQKTPIDRATGNLSAPLYRPTLGKTFESMHLANICQKSTENQMKIRRKLKGMVNCKRFVFC